MDTQTLALAAALAEDYNELHAPIEAPTLQDVVITTMALVMACSFLIIV